MDLINIEIKSYRSIVDQKIDVKDKCICLIGKNESGKSNILNAIRFLGADFRISASDRSKINNELPKVKYNFSILKDEIDFLNNLVDNTISEVTLESNAKPIKDCIFTSFSITKYLDKENGSLKRFKAASTNCELEVDENYYVLKNGMTIPADVTVKISEENYALAKFKIVHRDVLPEEYFDKYQKIAKADIRKIIDPIINKYLEDKIPEIIFWEYDDEYLLPSEITYDAFVKNSNPKSNSTPLFNVFLLSTRLNISDSDDLIARIAEWKTDSSLRRRDSQIITEDINTYIKSIWSDYDQEVSVGLEELKITIHVTDPKSHIRNYYVMDDRSQGFKTFVSFILTIAAEVEKKIISNFILVLDEPETHLHPSGVRFMRDELIKLSKHNNVFFATHSIFMIDRLNLKRHILIKKEKEITNLIPVERNNIMQESVIYEALGTTVDEFSIKCKNIVFEGSTDLQIFSKFIDQCIPKKENIFADYDLLDGGGCKSIYNFFRDKVIPAESKWILILDKDSPGRNLKTDLERNQPAIIKQLDFHYYSSVPDYEIEDLMPHDFIITSVNYAVGFINAKITGEFKIDNEKPIGKCIDQYKNLNQIDKKSVFEEKFKSKLHELIFAELEQMTKEGSYDKRREFFKKAFPKYYDFIHAVLTNYGLNID